VTGKAEKKIKQALKSKAAETRVEVKPQKLNSILKRAKSANRNK